MNQVNLIGRLTFDPELKTTNNGKPVCTFTIAVNRDKDKADFIHCTAFSKTAEHLHNYTEKGSRIALNGSIRVDNYTDQQGNKKNYTYVLVNNVEIIDFKGKAKVNDDVASKADKFFSNNIEISDDSLPF